MVVAYVAYALTGNAFLLVCFCQKKVCSIVGIMKETSWMLQHFPLLILFTDIIGQFQLETSLTLFLSQIVFDITLGHWYLEHSSWLSFNLFKPHDCTLMTKTQYLESPTLFSESL
ncbi:hypothetical protein PHMEG_00032819 [Phytophthora megakarya]|uniref:Uncharacterized protein n=1 Tax=Phytophthora megakarya TaxID=4795 RepID=A0A225UV92_9STRA|nr:hypothetical protein PHMEG_00032819 [Phytophthora megakarya]